MHEDFGIRSAESSRVAVAKIDTAVRQADVVENGLEFVRGNGAANEAIDLVGETRSFFNAQASASAEVQADLSGVDFGKEIAAQDEDQAGAKDAENQEAGGEEQGTGERGIQRAAVTLAKPFEAMFKKLLQLAEETLLFAFMFFRVVLVRGT